MNEVASYDIAVSFDEAQRGAVDGVVEACRQRGLTVLHGHEHTHDWWAGKSDGDLPDARIRLFVPLVATIDDFTAAVLRAVKAGDWHVLPVLVDDVAVPADLLHPHVTYVRGKTGEPDQLADALATRIERAESAGWHRGRLSTVVVRARETTSPTTVPATFSRYAEQAAALRYLGEQFTAAMPGLGGRGFVGTAHLGDSRIALRIERAGDTVYALDIQRGGIGGDETVNFVVGRHDGDIHGSACTNGWARPVYDTEAGGPRLELHGVPGSGRSVLEHGNDPRAYTKEELFTALWQRIDTVLTATAG
ncbi:hypothetical protein EV186_105215 [Labedaea rhizosphaerae]|uniref:TIR domain-containing protein n=1 Tax=Labedaea rhizosphaerae TaxID=598644 RepID=A0A4R6S6K8_LABRH|nr:hypothetical protein EV186_105215 [Labedaea rhizosphaerae]